jgi:hypothetical protein
MSKFLSRKNLSRKYEYLGEGSGRMVFAISNDYVMKVPKNNYGIEQNDIENYIYNDAEERFKKYLCPIISYQLDLIIAVRATPLAITREYFDNLRIFCGKIDFYQDILDLSKKYHLSKRDIKATSSWGMINKQKVIIDYGTVLE